MNNLARFLFGSFQATVSQSRYSPLFTILCENRVHKRASLLIYHCTIVVTDGYAGEYRRYFYNLSFTVLETQ